MSKKTTKLSADAQDRLMIDRAAYTPRKPPLPRNIRNKIIVKNSPLTIDYQFLASNKEFGKLGAANQRIVSRASTMAPYQPGKGPTRTFPRGPGFSNTSTRDPFGYVAKKKPK